jgi:hypothetical protein
VAATSSDSPNQTQMNLYISAAVCDTNLQEAVTAAAPPGEAAQLMHEIVWNWVADVYATGGYTFELLLGGKVCDMMAPAPVPAPAPSPVPCTDASRQSSPCPAMTTPHHPPVPERAEPCSLAAGNAWRSGPLATGASTRGNDSCGCDDSRTCTCARPASPRPCARRPSEATRACWRQLEAVRQGMPHGQASKGGHSAPASPHGKTVAGLPVSLRPMFPLRPLIMHTPSA